MSKRHTSHWNSTSHFGTCTGIPSTPGSTNCSHPEKHDVCVCESPCLCMSRGVCVCCAEGKGNAGRKNQKIGEEHTLPRAQFWRRLTLFLALQALLTGAWKESLIPTCTVEGRVNLSAAPLSFFSHLARRILKRTAIVPRRTLESGPLARWSWALATGAIAALGPSHLSAQTSAAASLPEQPAVLVTTLRQDYSHILAKSKMGDLLEPDR